MTATNKLLIWLGVGVGVYILYEKYGSLFNPLSQNNLANTAFNSAYQSLTGSQGTLGTDLYNLLHPYDPNSTTPQYFVYDANGNLVKDSSGNLLYSTDPSGTGSNPYPNPHAVTS